MSYDNLSSVSQNGMSYDNLSSVSQNVLKFY
jgi:hypothetical protein